MANRYHDDERQHDRRGYGGREDARDWRGVSRRAGRSGPGRDWAEEDSAPGGRGSFGDRGLERRPHRAADVGRYEGDYPERREDRGFDEDVESRAGTRGGGAHRRGRSRPYDQDIDEDIGYADPPRSPYRDEDEYDSENRQSSRGFTPMDPDEYGEVTRRRGRFSGNEGYGARQSSSRYRDEFDAFERGSEGRPRYADRGGSGASGGGYSGHMEATWRGGRSPRSSAERGRGRDPEHGFGDAGPGQGGQGGYGGTSEYVSRSRYGGGGRGQRPHDPDEWEEEERRPGRQAASGAESGSRRGGSTSRGRAGSHADQARDEHGRFSSTRRSSGRRRSSGGSSRDR